VAPNGRDKSTLLKDQEVLADDAPVVEAVLQADIVRGDLMHEEVTLIKRLIMAMKS
jgi:hypothetical protein